MSFLTRLVRRIRNYFNPDVKIENRLIASVDKKEQGDQSSYRSLSRESVLEPSIIGRQQHIPIVTKVPPMRSVGRGTMIRPSDSVTVTNSYAVNDRTDTNIPTAIITAVVADTILHTLTPEPTYDPPSCNSSDGDSGSD